MTSNVETPERSANPSSSILRASLLLPKIHYYRPVRTLRDGRRQL